MSLQWSPIDPKFQVKGVAPTPKYSSSQKTRLNELFVWYKNLDCSVTMHAFHREMDRHALQFIWFALPETPIDNSVQDHRK